MTRLAAVLSLACILVMAALPSRQASAAGGVVPLPLVSRGVPAYTNDDCAGTYPASNADNANYADLWRTCGTPTAANPLWLAYDLSGKSLGQVVVAWYNDPMSGDYDTWYNQNEYNVPASYTLDANSAPGGSVPSTGWVTLASVTGNVYHSRQHVINLSGYNWLRLEATASYGQSANTGVALNLDVHDARLGLQDDWIMYGDSITAGGMIHGDSNSAVGSFAQLVNAQDPAYYPVQEDGGVSYLTSSAGAKYVPGWLALFPGHYVGLSYGTNDALRGCDATALSGFYANYVTMVKAVINAGKVPIVPTIPWGSAASLPTCVPQFNAEIAALEKAYPQIVPGPDLYSYFKANPGLISSDGIHPSTPAGMGAYRQQWANMALTTVYGTGAGTAAVSATPIPATASSSPVATPTRTPAPRPSSTPSATPHVVVSNSPSLVVGGRRQPCSAQPGGGNIQPGCESVSVAAMPGARVTIVLEFQDDSTQQYTGMTNSAGRLQHLFAVSFVPPAATGQHGPKPLSVRSVAHITVMVTLPRGTKLAPVVLTFSVLRP